MQVINRIVGRAEMRHIGHLDHFSRGHGLQLFIAEIIYLISSIFVENSRVIKIVSQFQMRPVVQRIADGHGDRFRPFLELCPVIAVTGDVFFLHAMGPHNTPFVMVAAEPHLGDRIKGSVFIDFLRT